MKRGDRVALTDSLFGGVTIRGWLWGTSFDEGHEQEPGCLIFTVLPFHEEGTANVWEGRNYDRAGAGSSFMRSWKRTTARRASTG